MVTGLGQFKWQTRLDSFLLPMQRDLLKQASQRRELIQA